MPLEGAFLIQLTSNFMSRLNFTIEKKKNRFLFAQHLSINGGKDKKPKNVCIKGEKN